MYAGHAAIALALKAREPRVPITPLLIACYGPDWAELVLGLAYGRGTMEVIAHSIPAVIAGALAAAGLFALVAHRHGARYLLIGWLSHWPADYLTARKPLIDLSHRVGLDLYNRPVIDLVLEGGLVVVACVLYARALVTDGDRRRWVLAMGAVLLAIQGTLDFGLRSAGGAWSPALAAVTRRPHPASDIIAGGRHRVRMALALPRWTNTASVQWRRKAPGV